MGIQASGDVFVWHKDKDELKTICGLAHFLLDADISLAGMPLLKNMNIDINFASKYNHDHLSSSNLFTL